jgi:hypothetical protein
MDAKLDWKVLDGGRLDGRQRDAVQLCHALFEAASGNDREARLVMIDVLAVLVIYSLFGRQTDMAAATHANHIMAIADEVDVQLSKVGRQ